MIFKQIDSSVDKTRKTLALFNKDWNTYKSNWQNANGLFGKIGSIFSSSTSNNIISNNQVQILRNWNNAVEHGCKQQETFNRIIANADENTKLYFSGLNKGKGSIEGLKNAQNAAETSTIGLTIAQTALNTAINMGIGLAVSYAVKGISKLINYQKELIEKSEEAISTFEQSRDSLSGNKQTIDDISSDYARLSQGVDSLGRNVSLNTEEYTRYNEIVNQIAEMFPQMVQGYTDEGNAIIANKGNVDELTKAYEEQKQAYQDLIITKSADTFTGYKAKVAETPWTESVKGKNGTYAYMEQKKYIDELIESLENGKQAFEDFYSNQYIKNSDIYDVLKSASKTAGIDWGGVMSVSERYEYMSKEQLTNLYSYQRQLINNINAETAKIKPIMSAYMEQSYDYQTLDSNVQDVIKQIVGQFDSEFYTQFSSETEMSSYITDNIVNQFKGIDGQKITEAFESSIDLKSKLENNEISLDEYLSAINEFKLLIDNFDDNTKKSVELIFSVNSSSGLNTDTLINNVKEKLQDDFDDKVGELTLKDLEIAANLDIPEGTLLSWDELIAKIEEVKEQQTALTNQPLSISKTIDQLNTQLKPAMDSLKSAYQDIFTDDGKFELNSIDILSTCDSIKSKLDEMSELGLNVDYSFFEDFVRVLNNSESEAWQVEDAFDSLATSITQAALSGAEDCGTMKAALEDLGVVNNEIVAFQTLINNTSALEETIQQAGLTMDEFVISTEDGTIVASEAAQAFVEEMVGAENCQQALALLQLQQVLCNENSLDTTDDINACLTLANAAGVAVESLSWLANVSAQYDAAVASGDTVAQKNLSATMESIKAKINSEIANFQPAKIDFSPIGSGAKSAGKAAGKDYKDALKEELSDLESVISGVTGRIDAQISSINEQKSTALDAIDAEKEALEEAKDAAIDALEAERDAKLEAIEVQISSKQKIIDGINDEIDAIREANDERQRQLDLQKAQYELERMQNQRTILQYSEAKGMHYVTDTSGIRDAKDAVEDIKTEIEISNKEKQIKLLEKEIDLLNERKDEINEYYDDLIEKTEKYYNDQINALEKQRKETESYFESLTENLETQKSKFQELTELLEKAELSAKLKQLGIDEEALLNGSEEEFEKLKTAYLDIVYQLNAGNDDVLEKLRELSGYEGTAPTVLSDSNTELDEMNGKLNESNTSIGNVNTSLGETASTTSDVATNVSEMSSNLTEATAQVIEEQTAFNNLKLKIDEVIEAINQKTEAIKEEQNATSIATSSEMADFLLLKEKILEVKETLESFGTPEEGLISDIASAIQSLNDIKLDDGLIEQFNNLKTAIDSVTSAISGGGGESSDSEGRSGDVGKGSGTRGKYSKGEGSGGGSLTDALTSIGETAAEVIGEADAEGDGTVIGEFGSLKTAVNNVTSAIGSGESEDGKGKGGGEARDKDGNGEDSGNLIGSIVNLGETTEETLGEPGGDGVIGRFEQFKEPIAEAAGHVHSISDGLDKIDGKKVECTITVNVNQKGNTYADGTVLGSMNLNNAAYTAQYGKALANGTGKYKGLPKLEKDALVSEYGQTEMTVLPNGNTIITDGPTLMDLPKGTVIFNETQTKQLMRNKIHVDGNTHGDNSTSNILPATSGEIKIIPFQPSDQMYDYIQKWNAYFGDTDNQIGKLIPNSIYERSQQMHNIANQITNGNITNKNQPNVHVGDIHITCPGVTSKEVAKQVGVELNHMFTGLHLNADQQSRMR